MKPRRAAWSTRLLVVRVAADLVAPHPEAWHHRAQRLAVGVGDHGGAEHREVVRLGLES